MGKLRLFSLVVTLLIISVLVIYVFSLYYGLDRYSGVVHDKILLYRRTRLLTALFVGLILGFSGSYLQSCLRNPLVDPYILGISGGALFTIYTYYLVVRTANMIVCALLASIGGLVALAITVFIAESIGGSDTAYVLAGIGVSSLFSGLSITVYYVIISLKPSASYVHTLLIGSFANSLPSRIPLVIASTVALSIAYILYSKPLNAVVIGDTYARQLGYNPRLIRRILIVLSGIASSIVVMVAGIIGFIGLVSPHIARLILKTSDNRLVVPVAGLTGSLLLLVTDNFSRIVLSEFIGEIPVGALASSFGAPFFIILLIRRFRGRI